jgi:hypothetical protein
MGALAAVACSVGLARVPVIERSFPNAYEAVRYAIARAQRRHNRTDAAIQRAVAVLDRLRPRGGNHRNQNRHVGGFELSAEETATTIGTNARTVERARRVAKHADLDAEVKAGTRTIVDRGRQFLPPRVPCRPERAAGRRAGR